MSYLLPSPDMAAQENVSRAFKLIFNHSFYLLGTKKSKQLWWCLHTNRTMWLKKVQLDEKLFSVSSSCSPITIKLNLGPSRSLFFGFSPFISLNLGFNKRKFSMSCQSNMSRSNIYYCKAKIDSYFVSQCTICHILSLEKLAFLVWRSKAASSTTLSHADYLSGMHKVSHGLYFISNKTCSMTKTGNFKVQTSHDFCFIWTKWKQKC